MRFGGFSTRIDGRMADVAGQFTREQRQLAELLLRQRGLDPAKLPIPRRSRRDEATLSMTQQRLWTSGRIAAGTSYGNVPMGFRIQGPLDVELLAGALSRIVDRHEILRTTYHMDGGRPVQRIRDAAPVEIAIEDLRSLGEAERERRFECRMREEARRPFDLARETQFRAWLFRLGEADSGLLMVSHHLAMDGWGARLLLDELSTVYRSVLARREPELPPLPVQYADYAEWEVGRLESDAMEPERGHWLDRLAGAPHRLRLPFDLAGSDALDTEMVAIDLGPELSERLRKFARMNGITPYGALLAAFKVVLHLYSGEHDVIVGTILSRRTRSETESLIGNFGNNLLLRTELRAESSLIDIVRLTAVTLRDALAHSEVPLELVAQRAPIPAFHLMFILRDGHYEERLTQPDIAARGVDVSSGAATLDLILDLTDGSRGIEGHLEYRSARFTPDTARRLAETFERVVLLMVQRPDARLGELPVPRIERATSRTEQPTIRREAPTTRTEQILAGMWRSVLDVESIDRSDNFFRLGGDSLRAVYVLEQMERELGYRCSPEDLNRVTLKALAALCEGREEGDAATVEGSDRGVVVRRVNPLGRGDQIKMLFERETLPGYVQFFDRAYPEAVDAGAASWVVLDEDDRVTGHLAIFPHRFTCDGVEYAGGLGANLVMDRRRRNLVNAIALVDTAVADLERERSVDFVFGDPNDDARSIMTSIGGFTDIGCLTRFVLPIAEPGILGPAVALYLTVKLHGDGDGLAMEERSAFEFDPSAVETAPGVASTLRGVHPRPLYRRRLEGYPTDRDSWYVFRRDSEVVAAALVRRFRGSGLAHLCSIRRQPGVPLASVVRPMVADLRSRGSTRLQVFSLESSALGRELRAVGFRAREGGIRFIVRPCSPRGRALLEQKPDWEITDLDCDRGLDQ